MTPVLTLGAGGEPSALVQDLLIILVAAAVVALLSRRLRLALIPAYLITGVLIGSVFGFITDDPAIESISSMALILLMFDIGLHLDLDAFKGALGRMIGIGVGSTLLSVAGGFGLSMLFRLDLGAALVVAMALSLSSTAVVLRTLQQRRLLKRMSGRLSFSVLVVQDLIVVVMLASMAPLAQVLTPDESAGGAPAWNIQEIVGDLLLGVGGVGLLVVGGRIVLPRLFAEAARASTEVMLILAAAVAMGAAALTGRLGFSPELGAFVAGFLLACTPFRSQIAGQVSPLRDLLLAVFFTSIGLTVATSTLRDAWWVILLAVPVLLVLKTVTISVAAWAGGSSARVASTAGLWLAQSGEFSLVVLAAAGTEGLVGDDVTSIVIAVVVLSLIVTPGLITLGDRLGSRLTHVRFAPWARGRGLDEAEGDDHDLTQPFVVIVGFGPVGRTAAERFERAGIRLRIIELNPKTVEKQRTMGRDIVYGDATNIEVLKTARVGDADAVILTIPDDEAMVRACRAIRSISSEVFLAARATYLSKSMLARAEGANQVIVEEMAAAESMANLVQEELARREAEAGAESAGDGEAEATGAN